MIWNHCYKKSVKFLIALTWQVSLTRNDKIYGVNLFEGGESRVKEKPGKINEIVYNNTAYYNGKYRYYPTITGLNGILEEIINSNSTTDYIRITPFYVNEQLERQIEFEEYMF